MEFAECNGTALPPAARKAMRRFLEENEDYFRADGSLRAGAVAAGCSASDRYEVLEPPSRATFSRAALLARFC